MKRLHSLIGIVLAFALAAFSGPILAKTFNAVFVDADGNPTQYLPNGDSVTVRLKIDNLSTEPSTINSLMICTMPNLTWLSASGANLGTYTGPTRSDQPSCGGDGGTTIVDFSGIRRTKSATFVLTAKIANPGFCTPTNFKVYANTGNAYPGGSEFDGNNPTGDPAGTLFGDLVPAKLGCLGEYGCPSISANFPYQFSTASTTIPAITGIRGENKNLSTCQAVAIQINDLRATGSTTSLGGQAVDFKWDDGTQPTAAYEYTIPWLLEQVGSDGLPDLKVRFSWKDPTTSLYTPEVDGRFCIADSLPYQVASLGDTLPAPPSDLSTQQLITVNTTGFTVPTAPFAVSIGSNDSTERMLVVQVVSDTQWSVLRRNGGTPASDLSTMGTKIARNPLPLDGSGKQMQMCIKKHVEFAAGGEACTVGVNTSVCSLYGAETTVFDFGDGITIYK